MGFYMDSLFDVFDKIVLITNNLNNVITALIIICIVFFIIIIVLFFKIRMCENDIDRLSRDIKIFHDNYSK